MWRRVALEDLPLRGVQRERAGMASSYVSNSAGTISRTFIRNRRLPSTNPVAILPTSNEFPKRWTVHGSGRRNFTRLERSLPYILSKDEPHRMKVLVPLDDSELARAALEHAVTTFPDAEFVVVHVINPSVSAYSDDPPYNFQRAVEAEEEAADRLFEMAREVATEHDVPITTETLVGSPARGIVECAEENNVGQIIIGSHGRSGLSRVLLGSVAENVVRRAPVPVTVVR